MELEQEILLKIIKHIGRKNNRWTKMAAKEVAELFIEKTNNLEKKIIEIYSAFGNIEEKHKELRKLIKNIK